MGLGLGSVFGLGKVRVRAAVGADAHAAVEVAADLDERREGLRDVLTVPQEVLVGLVRL